MYVDVMETKQRVQQLTSGYIVKSNLEGSQIIIVF